MSNILIRKLELFGPLSDVSKALLNDIVSRPQTLEAGAEIIREGDSPNVVHLIVSGMACRFKTLEDGGRQIFAYLLPGDVCDPNSFILKSMDHSISTLSPCELVEISPRRVLEMTSQPELARALTWATLVEDGILREWLVNLGSRSTVNRLAHLFCELHLRLQSVGLADGSEYELPITQAELGDTMGVSSVHVSRTLQELRSRNLIKLRNGRLKIPNLRKLKEVCGFNPNYLHLQG